MAKNDEPKKLAALAKGMMGGDKKAMETFFEYVDMLEDKKLKKDGRLALTMVVGVVRLLLPKPVQSAYSAASEREQDGAEPETKERTKSTPAEEGLTQWVWNSGSGQAAKSNFRCMVLAVSHGQISSGEL